MIIKIDTSPSNVEIYLDNEYIGKSPIDITDVDDDVHSYRLKRSETEQFDGTLHTYPGKITHITFDFSDYSKTEKYESILSAQETCSTPSVDMTIPEDQNCSSPSIDLTIPENEACPNPSVDMIIPDEQPTQPQTEQPQAPTEQPPSEQPPTEQPPAEQPPTEQPQPPAGIEAPPLASLDDVLGELQKTNNALETILQDIEESKKPRTSTIYDNKTTITTSVPNDPNDPVSGVYQLERIHDTIGHNAEIIYVYNYGPGLLYIVTSVNGIDFTKETLILEGEKKDFTNIYTLGLRSPTTLLRYEVTERPIANQASQQFSGSRFKDRRDRRGVIVFQDDYEPDTVKFQATNTGTGTTLRSTDTAYDGLISVKAILDNINPNASNTMTYFHTDFHTGKLAIQVRFAAPTLPGGATSPFGAGLTIIFNNVNTALKGEINILFNGNTLVLHNDGTRHIHLTNFPITESLFVWNSAKLVIDISTGFYSSMTVNGIEVDLSVDRLQTIPFITANQIYIQGLISALCENGGVACPVGTIVYFDNYIFTEDES